jgi:hypothetical protein
MGQGDTQDNKEEFQGKNHLLALLQFLEKGLQCSQPIVSSYESSPAAQTNAGLLCEGARLALLSSQMFSTQCPSASKDAQGFQRAGRVPHESQRIGIGVVQILVMPSMPAGPMSWAQTA